MSEEEQRLTIMNSIINASPEDYQIGVYAPKPGKRSTWVMASDGLYNIIDNNVFIAVFQMAELNIPGLPSGKNWNKFELKLPKIPYSLFERLILFYRHIYDLHSSEVFVALYYDTVNEKWNFEIPKQKVSGGLVEWDTKVTSKFDNTNNIFAMESHSHHTMFGHFSSVDDADQQLPERIHLVIGKIKDNEVEYTIRVKNKKAIIDLDLFDVFEGEPDLKLVDTFEDFPNWKDNVEKSSKFLSKSTEFDSNANEIYGQFDDDFYTAKPWGGPKPWKSKEIENNIIDEEDYSSWNHL